MTQDDVRLRYLRRLQGWPAAMRRYLYALPGRPDLGCFGTGDHGNWGMQANNTAAAAFAVLACEPAADLDHTEMRRDEVLCWALRLVRFALHSHHAGGGVALDGSPWGHTWISALCIERMMHGLEALQEHLTDADRDALKRVLVSECDWLLDAYHRGAAESPGAITAGLVNNNHPENNIWNGCILHRTARMFPDTPRRDEYLDKGTGFLLNGISVEADAASDEPIAGKRLADWHVGANFFPSYALNHHGYLNVGYMAICLSNIAMLHFSCRSNGWAPPEGLYHHARELWQLVKTCTFPDGRLWRIGGDTRVRYCYCQDYAVPTWLLALDHLGDSDAEAFECGWLSQLDTEAAANPDTAFLSARLSDLEAVSPLYYTRLEGDRAVSLSMGALWRRRLETGSPATAALDAQRPAVHVLGNWSDAYHGSMMVRGSRRLASWTWRAGQPPQGQCIPPWASSMAEWQGNLAGCVRGLGMAHENRCEPSHQESFAGGFATCGRVTVHSRRHVAEGEGDRDVAFIDLACVALPDDRSVVLLQRARTGTRAWFTTVGGLLLRVPNDVFNGMRRTAVDAGGQFELQGCTGTALTRTVTGDWLNLDGCLSVMRIFGSPLVVRQPAARQIIIRDKPEGGGNLFADEICCGFREGAHAADAGAILFDLGAVVLSGVDASETCDAFEAYRPGAVAVPAADVRCVTLRGGDRRHYCVAANFSAREEAVLPLPATLGESPRVLAGALLRSAASEGCELVIPPGQVALAAEDA